MKRTTATPRRLEGRATKSWSTRRWSPTWIPTTCFFILNGYRDLFEEMGQTIYDERYEDILLQPLPEEYERVRNVSYEKRDFRLVDIRHMIHTVFVDSPSPLSHSKPVPDRGIAM